MNIHQRAMQLWSVLALAASNRQVLTYGIVGRAVGTIPAALGKWLAPIQAYCIRHELPPLTVLVVNQETGVPGEDFVGAADIPAAQMRVFAYDWLKHGLPSAEDFAG